MEEKETCYHVPVMLDESVKGLNIQEGGIYVDVTFGGGGHSREILKRMDSDGELYGFDQDADAEHNIPDDSRFVFVRSNFRYLYNFMRYHGVDGEVDGLLADLGVSSHHFDDKDRGFSFRFDGALDMRMNTRAGQTAADIVNNYTEEALADVFYLYGELKVARRLASLIVRTRENKKIETIGDFLELVKPFTGKDKEKKFLAQAFQALRIEVNDEMRALKEMLQQTLQVLKPGGRLLAGLDPRLTMHDFRITSGPDHTNLIFDVVRPLDSSYTSEELEERIRQAVTALEDNYYAVITVDTPRV